MNNCTPADKLIAQTLFLGASVSSFHSNLGWSGQSSQLTVNLVTDEAPSVTAGNGSTSCSGVNQFVTTSFGANHYQTCLGDACYVDKTGATWNNTLIGTSRADGSIIQPDDKMVPGKVYYDLGGTTDKDPVRSQYHYAQDPGFLGSPNFINIAGSVVTTKNIGYDIIGTPVYFKMGNFSFGGVVQSWQEDFNSGGKQYRVTIDGMQSVLNNAYIIISQYGGAIFSKYTGDNYGSPRNYVSNDANLSYTGLIRQGNIPNVFNVYGFLESTAPENFGGANCNEDGMSAVDIIDALSVLTGRVGGSLLSARYGIPKEFGPKTAYSPFGRILTKCMQTYDYTTISNSFNSWGVIPPQQNQEDTSQNRCEFLLDLSELPRPPAEFRIKGIKISITEFLNLVTEATGYDYSLELIPVYYNSRICNVIKVKTISRLRQPVPHQIQSTVNKLYCDGYQISSSTIGKERNDSPARLMIVGGPQQRLYQAKSYRLAYSQSNYILMDGKFVDYLKLGHLAVTTNCPGGSITRTGSATENFSFGKIRFPVFLSTRNPTISAAVNPGLANIFQKDDDIKSSVTGAFFAGTDTEWNDGNQITNGGNNIQIGNYDSAKKSSYTMTDSWGISTARPRDTSVSTRDTPYGSNRKPHLERYIPLYRDIICPFFGYIMDNSLSVDTSNSLNSREFRRIRPVLMDTWTGQICVVMKASEIPATRLNLEGLYGGYTLSNRRTSKLWTWRPQPTSSSPASTPAASSGGSPPQPSSPPASPPPPTPTPSAAGPTSTTIYGDWYFLVTESEIRAAMAGADNFLAYTLGKAYKTDLYIMMNSAYYSKQYSLYSSMGLSDAADRAKREADWSYKFRSTNASTPILSPTVTTSGRAQGLGHITEEVRQDFEVLRGLIAKLGESYYGKKYMVYAPYLGSRKDEFYDRTLTTSVGAAYVFRGGAKLDYNYNPTNDGAWEEPGNIIDDTIPVGSKDSYNLSDERGMIKPILGYNAGDSFDFPRYNLCQKQITQSDILKKSNPYFTYNSWEKIKVAKSRTCDPADFKFSTLNFGSLTDPSSYILKTLTTTGTDGFGLNRGFSRKKLYIKANVQEKIVFLDPEQLTEPRIIIEAPSAIELSSTSLQYQKDPNRTVAASINMEDLAIYLRTNDSANWDCHLIRSLLHGIQDVCAQYEGYLFGNLSSASHNTNAKNMDLRPKVAHPFFAGIPIKSRQYNYGPWINYPAIDNATETIFPSFSKYEKESCTSPTTVSVSAAEATRAIDNWILPTNVEYNPDFVPWNYGGMSYLDSLAYQEVKSKINYQSVLETASLEMVGLPIFNIGGAFNYQTLNNIVPIDSPTTNNISYTETKRTTDIFVDRPLRKFHELSSTNDLTISAGTVTYNVIKLPYIANYTNGPIISYLNVDVGRNGIKTTYSFRTYTRKLSLFNKENQDRFKKINKENLQRDKQISKLEQQIENKSVNEFRTLASQPRMNETSATNLLGKSPVEVITAIASPFLKEPVRSIPYIYDRESQTTPSGISTATYSLPTGNDLGNGDLATNAFTTDGFQIASLKNRARVNTSAQIFQITELNDFITQDYGSKAAMSLDGIFSPVSFYPTNNLGTFSFSKYDKGTCPVCNASRIRTFEYRKFATAGVPDSTGTYTALCDCCTILSEKLHSKLYSKSGAYKNSTEVVPPYIITDKSDASTLSKIDTLTANNKSGGLSRDINLISLQPIVVPYSEFKNPNVQNYSGAHPDGAHGTLQINSQNRNFIDRSRHSISIVARSAVKQNPNLEISNNVDNPETLMTYGSTELYNPDFFYKDLKAISNLKTIDSTNYASTNAEMNQRFIGLRGPLVIHGWGYDKDGYPVPNAADEPVDIDGFGRPKRFKLSRTEETTAVQYKTLDVGDIFKLSYPPPDPDAPTPGPDDPPTPPQDTGEYVKAKNLTIQNTLGYKPSTAITDTTNVLKVKYKDDLTDSGGFDPAIYQGSIISKTQTFSGGRWTPKKKLNEFYLNWAEHPEVWPVGPVDLRWDEFRKVWTANNPAIYKMMYVTLEEDLTRNLDLDETYPARGFFDDVEFSSQPSPSGSRRLVFVKDRCGYTAPRGAKLLCRYDADAGFYEPVSKPSFIVKGTMTAGSNQANIEMSFIQGKKKSENYPSMLVNFENPFDLPTTNGRGLFTYLNGKWTLTTSK
jgi:hypothetical protein